MLNIFKSATVATVADRAALSFFSIARWSRNANAATSCAVAILQQSVVKFPR
jgi:hypothetical protein